MQFMQNPKTNREGLNLVISVTETQSALAKRLGLVRQYVSRWEEIPLQFALQTAELTGLPVEKILPEIYEQLEAIIGPTDKMADLIRLLCKQPYRKKPKPTTRKRRRATGAK